ncbi:vWA domain-containing protein [Tautonia sociabilis]|uniref:VWA domain-containing protein n=1 Tax=Tautonia sociabilis TaxID=2080755 RepID=A0A432MGD2_9BACT|nr:VWA domain-containing protein [Tautonia sociabilis]RUL85592.1 VWA domain-containing protein [Tautonia sociabilis]
MQSPHIEVIARKSAICSDATVSLDLLVKITPPRPDRPPTRPRLNLALVLDRSGSMAASRKIDYAREAASFAVAQLLTEDLVSITTFDDQVETIAENAPAVDKPGLLRKIALITPRSSTNLHGGWAEGVRQAEAHRIERGLNRVLLLSDGLANVGLTDPNAIALEVKSASLRGVGTTTIGLGDDYNEDLLEAMARAGDGNYYYVESPAMLTDLFQTELLGLMATVGRSVRLAIEPSPGVVVSDVLNDLQRSADGRLMLPNLVAGMPVLVLIRLSVPPQARPGPLCAFLLSWDGPEGGIRFERPASYAAPETMPLEWWAGMPEHAEVVEQEALLMAARAQKEAALAIDRGDIAASRALLKDAARWVNAAPCTFAIAEESRAISSTEAALEMGDYTKTSKRAKYRSYAHGHSRPTPPEPKPPAS